jgi:hypothetical protein
MDIVKIRPTQTHWRVFAVASLLAIHLSLAFVGILGRSVTSDETGHLTAGYTYWIFNDYRLQPENGSLPQRWGALPLLFLRPELNRSSRSGDWEASRVWNVAQTFLFESGNNTDFLLLCARLTMLFWSAAAGFLVFCWARSLWGNASGVGALTLFAFSPTTLAHGPLVTSDMCAAVCLLAATWAWWRMCLMPGGRRIAVAGIATGLAFVAKFSAILLLPVFACLGAVALSAEMTAPEKERKPKPVFRLGAAFACAALIAIGLIWMFFGFRYAGPNPAQGSFATYYLPWESLLSGIGWWNHAVEIARRCCLLPEAFLYGFSFVLYFSHERGAFLAGNFSSTGWWWFFPFAFLVKSTVGELLATTLVATRGFAVMQKFSGLNIRKIAHSPITPLILFALVIGTVSLTSSLNIGQRHILPLYLVLFILAGGLFSTRLPRWIRAIGAAAVLFSAIESLSNHPNHLAFFNRLSGGPQNGWRLLVDSSLDWGQDVSALGQWVQKNRRPGEQIYVSCFGTSDPTYEGIEGKLLSPYYSLGRQRYWYELEPGLYCISATMLQDVYGIRPGPWTSALERDFQNLKTAAGIHLAEQSWTVEIPNVGFHPDRPLWLLDRLRFARLCQYLKVKEPETVINHTQFVFRVSAEELDAFWNKPYSALATLMESAVSQK